MPKFWIVKIWINVAWYLLTFLCALKVSSGDLIRFSWNLYTTVVIFCFHYVVVKMLIKFSMYQFCMNLEISKMHFSLSKLCLVCSLHANNWFQNNQRFLEIEIVAVLIFYLLFFILIWILNFLWTSFWLSPIFRTGIFENVLWYILGYTGISLLH